MNKKRLQKGLKILETELVFNYKETKEFFDSIKMSPVKDPTGLTEKREKEKKTTKELLQ